MKINMSVVEREILLTVVEELLPKSNTELLVWSPKYLFLSVDPKRKVVDHMK